MNVKLVGVKLFSFIFVLNSSEKTRLSAPESKKEPGIIEVKFIM